MTKTVIELNGRRYNASTGAPLDQATRSLDGFVVSMPMQAMAAPEPAGTPAVTNRGSHHAQHHPVQHSRTLMRQSVHNPGSSFKRHAHTTSHSGALVEAPRIEIAPKHSAQNVDNDRLARAGQVSHSEYIRRFATNIPVQRSEPAFVTRPAMPDPTPTMRHAETVAHQPSDDIFERALAAANSHKETYTGKTKHKAKHTHRLRTAASVLASVVAVVLIAGFVAYQNMSFIQLRLASSHAGINATLPAWQPSGFHIGTFAYSHDNVAITYDNRTSSQSYTISQTATTWNTASLLNTYVYPNNQTYDTLTSDGTTIYTYGNNNATWVNHGIWYKLISDGNLSNSQIVNIATSMQS